MDYQMYECLLFNTIIELISKVAHIGNNSQKVSIEIFVAGLSPLGKSNCLSLFLNTKGVPFGENANMAVFPMKKG